MPEGLSPAGFLEEYWQKRPLFMPSAMARLVAELDPDELAWLATLEDVESRLVFTEISAGTRRYRLEQGPFSEQKLASLPDSDWTLLVQDVDKHLPDFRRFLKSVPFVPDWRIDDVMVSFAAPGGSVGPHLDNYDVFLVQGSGARDWQLADRDGVLAADDESDLSLLQPFVGAERFHCTYGDVLYLPPEVPHWGVASDACMTYSIGARALEASEFELVVDRVCPHGKRSPGPGDRQFYIDPDLSADEGSAGRISAKAIERARRWFPFAAELRPAEFAVALGCAITATKAWLTPEGVPPHVVKNIRTDDYETPWRAHGMARLAWCDLGATAHVFANGNQLQVSTQDLAAFRGLCSERLVVPALLSQPLVGFLLQHGAIDTETVGLAN